MDLADLALRQRDRGSGVLDVIPDVNKDPSKYSEFIAGGGKEALDKKGQTVDEVIEQGKKNIQGYDSIPQKQDLGPQKKSKVAEKYSIAQR